MRACGGLDADSEDTRQIRHRRARCEIYRDPIAALSARSSGMELELGLDVVSEGSPLFGSAMGTFVFVSLMLAVLNADSVSGPKITPVA